MNETALVRILQMLSDGRPLARDVCIDVMRDSAGDKTSPARTDDWIDAFAQRALADHGVDIGATHWQLRAPMEVLRSDAIARVLSPTWLRELRLFWSIGSTNTHLLELAAEQSIDGIACTAEHQSAGRGRRGRQWLSPVACNLYLSIGAEFTRLQDISGLSLGVGVAVAEALQDVGAAGVRLKWPNDVHHHDRKLAGILLESAIVRDGVAAVVIGIGINVRVPGYVAEQIDQPWVDVATLAGSGVSRNALCAHVLHRVGSMLEEWRRDGAAPVLAKFEAWDGLRGRTVQVQIGQKTHRGVADGVDVNGELLLSVQGRLMKFNSGEVSVRAAPT